MKKFVIALTLTILAGVPALAQDYIAVSHDATLFDEPSAKAYATTNQQGNDVVVLTGMAFKKIDERNGWTRIEYTPGLKAYINGSMTASPAALSTPKPGDYTTVNSSEKVSVTTDSQGLWKASSHKGTFDGKEYNKVIVFADQFQNTAYTLLTLSGRSYLFDYTNSITKFF